MTSPIRETMDRNLGSVRPLDYYLIRLVKRKARELKKCQNTNAIFQAGYIDGIDEMVKELTGGR